MPFVVFKKINYDIINEEEGIYYLNPAEFQNDIDNGQIDFEKIRKGIKDLHKMFINDYETARKYMIKKYNFSETNIIWGAIGETILKFDLHNRTKKQIKDHFKEFNKKSLKQNLTYDIQIEI
jgi:CRISPR/Cas system-associated protein Cas10 (large subunit of type III CRISPR-Cas system)